MRSNWLPEIVKRAQTGPYMKEADFDLKLTRRIKELGFQGVDSGHEAVDTGDDGLLFGEGGEGKTQFT